LESTLETMLVSSVSGSLARALGDKPTNERKIPAGMILFSIMSSPLRHQGSESAKHL
jgi:hypothetical protein